MSVLVFSDEKLLENRVFIINTEFHLVTRYSDDFSIFYARESNIYFFILFIHYKYVKISENSIPDDLSFLERPECDKWFLDFLSFLKLEIFSFFFHLLLEKREDWLRFPGEKISKTIYILSMCIKRCLSQQTRSRTYSNIVVHTWKGSACFIRDIDSISLFLSKFHSTVSNLKYFSQSEQCCLNTRGKRTKIYSSIIESLPSLDNLRNTGISDFDIGKIFIILHQDIVLWREMLDKIRFKHECLNFGCARQSFYISDLTYHLLFGKGEFRSSKKVWTHTTLQIFRFSYIQNLPSLIFHLVNTRRFRKVVKNFLYVLEIFFFHIKNNIKNMQNRNFQRKRTLLTGI